jgi:hypothetical protein
MLYGDDSASIGFWNYGVPPGAFYIDYWAGNSKSARKTDVTLVKKL